MYKSKEILQHTSFLIDKLTDDSTKWSFSDNPNNNKNRWIEKMKKELFDFIRDENKFKQLIEQLNKA